MSNLNVTSPNTARLLLSALLISIFFSHTPLNAEKRSLVTQSVDESTRVTAPIDNAKRSTLEGSRPPRALPANDIGAVAGDLQLHSISIVLSLTPAQQTALDELALSQQDSGSTFFHQWITPERYAAQFGVSDADIATVETWLVSEGFSIDSVSRSRNRIFFSGSAAQVTAAFGTTLHYYKAPGETIRHFAPSTDLSIPSAIFSVVQAVQNLSSFRPHTNLATALPKLTPLMTSSGGATAYLTPTDVATVYDVKPAYSNAYTGTGQTIAVVGQSAVDPADLTNFQRALGIPVVAQTLNLIPGTGTSEVRLGDQAESDLDLEYSSAMAPGAAVSLYYAGSSSNALLALEYVIDNNLGNIISFSYAICEPAEGAQAIAAYDLVLEQAAVQGQTVVAASGDFGSVSCAQDSMEPSAVQFAPAVDFPASSPWVVAMGGTQFPEADIGGNPVNPTYWGPAPNGDVVSTALSYIPEQVWNRTYMESSASGGGGGISAFELQPPWQTGVPGISVAGNRMVPDISLASSPNYPGYLMCSNDTLVFTTISMSCTNGFRDGTNMQYNVIGGTSVAAPIFAGLVAVLNQAKGYTTGQGLINPTLYALAANPTTYASAFHDITIGDNSCNNLAVCGVGPQDIDYPAGVGYDEASGLGSIDFAHLVTAWPQSSGPTKGSTVTTLSASTNNMSYGTPLTLTAKVSGSPALVTFLDNGTAIGSEMSNSSGLATLSPSSASIQTGANILTASYAGDIEYQPSTSVPDTVNVTIVTPIVSLGTSSSYPVSGAVVILTATVTANGNPAGAGGAVLFYSNGKYLGGGVIGSNGGTASMSVSNLAVGANSITALLNNAHGYASVSSVAPIIVDVLAAPSSVLLSSSAANSTTGSPVTLTATVTASTSVNSGIVTFLNGLTSIGTGSVNNSGVATVSVTTLPTGSNSITANYAGTATYATANSNTVIVMVTGSTTTTLVSSATSVGFGNPINLTATVSASGAPPAEGTVNFLDGGNSIGTGNLSNGVSVISVATLAAATHVITASFSGTTNYLASASNTVTETVVPSSTTTSLGTSTSSTTYGVPVTLTATVFTSSRPVASGTVIFLNAGATIGSGPVSNGIAVITVATLPGGNDTPTAEYSGTTNYLTSLSNPISVKVSPLSTITTLSASTGSIGLGTAVTFTATVSASGSPATNGNVTFVNGAATIGTVAVNSSGVSAISVATLPAGTDSITASFGNSSNYDSSTSSTVTVQVTTMTAAISAVAPAPVAPGSTATATVTLSAGNGYIGTMNLTCALTTFPAGAQSLPTCNFNPLALTVATNGKATSVLSVLTSSTTTARWDPSGQNQWTVAGGGTVLANLLLFCLPSRRRRLHSILVLFLTIALMATMGCSGNAKPSAGSSGIATTAGNYTFTLTGTDSVNPTLTAATTVIITVE